MLTDLKTGKAIPRWVEETLRYDNSTQILARRVLEPVEVRGTEIPEDSRVILLVGSAPCFPYGLVDPIPALGEVAERNDVWLRRNPAIQARTSSSSRAC